MYLGHEFPTQLKFNTKSISMKQIGILVFSHFGDASPLYGTSNIVLNIDFPINWSCPVWYDGKDG